MDIARWAFLSQLPLKRRKVYLDNNATTPLDKKVVREMHNVLRKKFGNPSSIHLYGRISKMILESSREQVASSFGAQASEILFTSGATESNNTVLKSLSRYFYPRKKKIISTPIEHPSIMATLEELKKQGIVVKFCPVDQKGRVKLEQLEKLMDKDCFLVCCMLANNEIGTIEDIKTINKIAKKFDCLVHCDCVQAAGKIPIQLKELGVDFASFSAHKFYGPKGIGALYLKRGSPLSPLIHGGHQERGLRAGTENLHNIAGFGAACDKLPLLLNRASHLEELKNSLLKGLDKALINYQLLSPQKHCLPNTISIRFPGVSNRELIAYLDFRGIAVSAASACSSRQKKTSHVLKAIGLPEQEAEETIRISLGHFNNSSDIKYTIKILAQYINHPESQVEMMSVENLNKKVLLDKDNLVLDLRPASLYKKEGTIPNSIAASFYTLEKTYQDLPKEKKIIVICPGGGYSFVAAYFLKKKGFPKVANLVGGFDKWLQHYPDILH